MSARVGPRYDTAADANLYVQFHIQPVLDPVASKEKGRHIYVDREFVRIGIPGDKGNIPDLQVRESHKERFPQQYAAFRAGLDQGTSAGTPLRLLAHTVPPLLTLGQVEEFAHFNVQTAEQLVGMPDAIAQKFMGIHDLRRKVQAWMDVTKSAAPGERMRAELEARDSQLAVLQQQVAEMGQMLKQQQAELEKRPPPAGPPASVPSQAKGK